MGSSPISNAVVVDLANTYPLVFLLYPLLSMAIRNAGCKTPIKYSTIGDFPVPPTAKLPIAITGK